MPKLTLRDLFAVVTIVALALGWWLDRSKITSQYQSLSERHRMVEAELRKELEWEQKYLEWRLTGDVMPGDPELPSDYP